MMNEETLLEQMTRVRPEVLNEEGLKLFNKIMEVIDERDKLLEENQELKNRIDRVKLFLCKKDMEANLTGEATFNSKELINILGGDVDDE